MAACALLGLAVAGSLLLTTKPIYTAQTQLFVATNNPDAVTALQAGNTFVQSRVQSYAKTAMTPAVLQPAIDSLGLAATPDQLASSVKVSADSNTVLLTIGVNDPSPTQAASIARAVADSLVSTVTKLESTADGGRSPVRLTIVTPATTPSSPSAPVKSTFLAVGLVVGLFSGAITAIVGSSVNGRVRDEEDLAGITGASILSTMAFDKSAQSAPLIPTSGPPTSRTEYFRKLRINLSSAQLSGDARTVLITSSVTGEGKTTTAVNLAAAIAQAGKSVVLVDADLRRPAVADLLRLDAGNGLSSVLLEGASVDSLLQSAGQRGLRVLTSGRAQPNSTELLGTDAMKALIAELEEKFDAVIIDSPPLQPAVDAAVLAQSGCGVVMVVGARKVRISDVEASFEALRMVDAHILGVVLNGVHRGSALAYARNYDRASGNGPTKQRQRAVHSSRHAGLPKPAIATDIANNVADPG